MRLIDATKAIESIDEIAFSMSVCISTDYCHGMTAMKDAAIHAVERQPTVDAVPWEFLERYADWFCASVSFPEFIKEAKAFYNSSVSAMNGGVIADGERRSE